MMKMMMNNNNLVSFSICSLCGKECWFEILCVLWMCKNILPKWASWYEFIVHNIQSSRTLNPEPHDLRSSFCLPQQSHFEQSTIYMYNCILNTQGFSVLGKTTNNIMIRRNVHTCLMPVVPNLSFARQREQKSFILSCLSHHITIWI